MSAAAVESSLAVYANSRASRISCVKCTLICINSWLYGHLYVLSYTAASGSRILRTQNAQHSPESERECFISDSELASRLSRAHDSWALRWTFPAHFSRYSKRASKRDSRRGNYRECASGPQAWLQHRWCLQLTVTLEKVGRYSWVGVRSCRLERFTEQAVKRYILFILYMSLSLYVECMVW